MDGMLWSAAALLLSALLSIVVATRELRGRNYTLGGFAIICLVSCLIALFAPVETHAVKVDVPVRADAN
ncbi:putative membrane protein [Sphingomonas kyeonggiensis]|uniref:hypothetical protein n=1 Tax=Sphingomonas kyeonggiensis TaxID=1268553 RepID=UPI002785B07B|nr:hypothetical protein [Sphingomonas kyeonggiensis]MDQ0247980.1 putative membrane protein [Sphingomonas kyeonggiensis]